MHACMHACIHTYIHTFIHSYIHTFIHSYIDYIVCTVIFNNWSAEIQFQKFILLDPTMDTECSKKHQTITVLHRDPATLCAADEIQHIMHFQFLRDLLCCFFLPGFCAPIPTINVQHGFPKISDASSTSRIPILMWSWQEMEEFPCFFFTHVIPD